MGIIISEHYKALGSLMRAKRKDKDLTQTQIGDYVGVTKSMVSKWERGLFLENSSISNIARICSILELDPLLFVYQPEDITAEEYIKALRAILERDGVNLDEMSNDEILQIIIKTLKL